MPHRIALALVLALAACARPAPPEAAVVAADPGLVVRASAGSFDETVARLASALDSRGLRVFATVDHAANAAGAGLELRPTTLFVFGNPKTGTPFMAESPSMGLDLPMKMLVWQDDDGTVRVAYNDPRYLVRRHGIEGLDELTAKVEGALASIAAEAAGAP